MLIIALIVSASLAHQSVGEASHEQSRTSCEAGSSGSGGSLLQAGSNHLPPLTLAGKTSSVFSDEKPQSPKARDVLPKNLYDLGLQLMHSEDVLDAVVANTVEKNLFYAGANITLRVVVGDGSVATNAKNAVDDYYGLDTLEQRIHDNGGLFEKVVSSGVMNMLDVGGNYGLVTLAAFKLYKEKMRIIVAEPVPSTFLLLRWNLWLNGIPELTLDEFKASPTKVGVVPLNNGVSSEDMQTLGLCYTPPFTMNAKICDCSKQVQVNRPQDRVQQCESMVGRNLDSLLEMFGDAPISLLKMDCEGCETAMIPSFSKLQSTSPRQIVRFAGEFHASSNDIEDVACQFEGGQYFVHICFLEGKYESKLVGERCQKGAARPDCSVKGRT
jgi:FkbM family methyltransferase